MERKLRKKRERARPVSCPAGGERVRVRGGARTQNVIMHGVLSPPLRDAPPHGITPLRYKYILVLFYKRLQLSRLSYLALWICNLGVQAVPYRTGREARYLSVSTE